MIRAILQVDAHHLVLEAARQVGKHPRRRDLTRTGRAHQLDVLVHETDIAHAFVQLAGKRKVRPGNVAHRRVLGVVGVEHHIVVIPHLEHRGATLGVDHTEVGFDPAGLGERIEEHLEILDGTAHLQGAFHHPAVRLAALLSGLDFHQIVRLGVHDGKTGRIGADPDLRRIVHAIDDTDKSILFAREVLHGILHIVRIAVFPQERTAVGSNFSGNYRRGTSLRGVQYADHQRKGERKGAKSVFFHRFSVFSYLFLLSARFPAPFPRSDGRGKRPLPSPAPGQGKRWG